MWLPPIDVEVDLSVGAQADKRVKVNLKIFQISRPLIWEREGGQLLLGGRWSQRDEMGHPARHTGHCLPPAQDGRLFALFFSTEETGGRCRPVALPLTGPWPPPKQGAERPGGGHDHRSLPSSSSAYISSQKKRNFTPLVFLSWGGFRFLTGRSLVEGKCLLFNYGMKKKVRFHFREHFLMGF